MADAEIPWLLVVMELAGGVALLLIGVGEVSKALKALSGTRLKAVLKGISGNRFTGAITGAVATAVMQSSSVTTVLTVSFVSAGIMSLTQAASVVIGANLGTTVTAQIVALDITEYSLGIVALGGVLLAVAKNDRTRLAGRATVGIGFVFLGLAAMSAAMLPLRDFEPFTNAMAATANPFVAALIGAAVAATIQSSSATTGIVVAMSAAGLIGLPTGIALVLGANIGTCVTAILAALGRGTAAMQTAVVHVLVNLLGALVWLFALDALVWLVESVSGSVGDAAIATPRELANAHTIFNAINTVVFLALLPLLVKAAQRIVPDRSRPAESPQPINVSDPLPSILPALHQRLGALAGDVRNQLEVALPAAIGGDRSELAAVRELRTDSRRAHKELVAECAEYGDEDLGEDQRDALEAVLLWGNLLDLVSSQINHGLLRAGRRRLGHESTISAQTSAVLGNIHELVLADFDRQVAPLLDPGAHPESLAPAPDSDDGDAPLTDAFEDAYRHLSNRLLTGTDTRTYGIEIEMLAALENVVSTFARFPGSATDRVTRQ